MKDALAEGRDLGGELALELELVHALARAFDPELTDEFWRERPRLRALARGHSWPARALAAALAETSACRAEYLDEVVPLCEHATAGDVLLSQRGAGAFASGHILLALGLIDANDRALDFADRVEAAARSQGSFANTITASACRGWILLRRGEFLGAEELLRPVLDAAVEQGVLLLVVNMLFLLPDLIAERSSQETLATMVETVELPPAFAEAAGGGWILSARGRLRALRGQRAAAESDLRRSGSIFEKLGFGPLPEPWRSQLALTLPVDARDEARALVAEELTIARATGLPRPQGVVLRAAGLLAEGDESIETLRESVAVLADSPARYEHARSLVELGAALRRAGRRTDAREPLRTGLELAHRCGAERLLQRARDELLAAGARPRRIARSGFDALTASERRIVRLAAEGRSNPEIAQALYLSVKTVERHLSNAYAKVELSGPGARRRLLRVVEQAERSDTDASAA